jgi:hypothetical protein
VKLLFAQAVLDVRAMRPMLAPTSALVYAPESAPEMAPVGSPEYAPEMGPMAPPGSLIHFTPCTWRQVLEFCWWDLPHFFSTDELRHVLLGVCRMCVL